MAKKHYIAHYRNSRKTVWCGTIEELTKYVFGYTLECGHSWNSKIPMYPKTINSFVKALNDSAYECRRYNDHYEIARVGTFDMDSVMNAVD